MKYIAERNLLKSLNNSKKWAMKVNRMSDKQVIAILGRLETQIESLRNIA